jgi:hypothetical protein
MAKDVNIKVKTEGVDKVQSDFERLNEELSLFNVTLGEGGDKAAQASQDQKDFADYLAKTAESAKDAGDAVQDGGQAAAEGMDNASKKGGFLEDILGKVRNQALGMVTGFLGIGGVIKLIDYLNEKLDNMIEKQEKLVDRSLSTAGLGQTMEAATGTVGKQDYWAKEVLGLQKAGGMESQDLAVEMMLKANEYFKGQGGIQNPAVMAMLTGMAPKLGASGKSKSDIDAIFEAATKEGIAPDAMESYLSKALGITDAQAEAYMQTPLAKSRSSQAEQLFRAKDRVTDPMANWKRRRKVAAEERDDQEAVGDSPRGITKYGEMKRIAYDMLAEDLEAAKKDAPDDKKAEYDEYIRRIREDFPINLELGKDRDNPRSQQHSLKRALEMAEGVGAGPVTINNDYSRRTTYTPIVGYDQFRRGGRVDPNDI